MTGPMDLFRPPGMPSSLIAEILVSFEIGLFSLTFSIHAHFQAFPKSTVLAPVSLFPTHHTLFVSGASINSAVTNRPFEKALAT